MNSKNQIRGEPKHPKICKLHQITFDRRVPAQTNEKGKASSNIFNVYSAFSLNGQI